MGLLFETSSVSRLGYIPEEPSDLELLASHKGQVSVEVDGTRREQTRGWPLSFALLPLVDPLRKSNSFSLLSNQLEVLDCSVLETVQLCALLLYGNNTMEHSQEGLVAG